MPMSKTPQATPPHGNTHYAWDKWMNGKWHTATKGRKYGQFRGKAETFRRFLHVKARKAAKQVTTRVMGNTVVFQFRDKDKQSAKESKA